MLSKAASVLGQLEAIADELQAREQADLAEQLRTVTNVLRAAVPPTEEPLITTAEAAQALGVRSVNTIKRWVRDGLLTGYRRGGRVLVTRSSVERMVGEPALARQHSYETGLAAALAPFDAGKDVAVEELETTTHCGRTPWTTDAPLRT